MNPYLLIEPTKSKAASYIYSIGVLYESLSGAAMKEPAIKAVAGKWVVVQRECSGWINLYLDDALYFRTFGKKWLGLTPSGEIGYMAASQPQGPKGPPGDFGIPISQINFSADVLIQEPEDFMPEDFRHRPKISLGTIPFMEKVYKAVMDVYNSMKPEITPLAVVDLLN